jgi:hypothetical protein
MKPSDTIIGAGMASSAPAPNRVMSPLESAFDRLDATLSRTEILSERAYNVATRLMGDEAVEDSDGPREAHGSGVTASLHARIDRLQRALDAIEDNIGRIESI